MRTSHVVALAVGLFSSSALAQRPLAPSPAAQKPDDRAREAVERGDKAYKDKNVDGALAAYQEAVKSAPNNALAQYRLGQAQLVKGDAKSAESAYDVALRNVSRDLALKAKLLFVIADMRERQKDYDRALEAWSAYETFAKEQPQLKLHVETAAERKRRITAYKQLLQDCAQVKARIEKRVQEADASVRKSSQ